MPPLVENVTLNVTGSHRNKSKRKRSGLATIQFAGGLKTSWVLHASPKAPSEKMKDANNLSQLQMNHVRMWPVVTTC